MKVIFAPYYDTNPYQKELIKQLELKGISIGKAGLGANVFFKTKGLREADVVHFHWFEPYLLSGNPLKSLVKVFVFLLRLKFLKKSKKYVWTAHNLKSHESKYPSLEFFFLKKFIMLIDEISVHNSFSKDKLIREYGVFSEKISIIPHANYINAYCKTDEARIRTLKSELGLNNNKFTFMFLGQIRPYKGVLDIIRAFKELHIVNAQLLICGAIKIKDDQKIIEKEIDNKYNIKLIPHYIKEEEVSSYLALADVMLYPYKDILTSGGLLLGMSYKKVCIASDVGSMSEFLDQKFLFDNYPNLISTMESISYLSKEELEVIGENNYSRIKADTWVKMAEMTLNLYKKH